MGGGDLNMKKDWHTQTIKNIRKVWEAEQQVEEEKKKMEIRLKELKAERERADMIRMQEEAGLIPKRGDRLEWMYSGPGSSAAADEDREAYLLGKKRIDLKADVFGSEESAVEVQKGPSLVRSEFSGFTGITAENEHRDLLNKIREDPVFAIRMREKQQIERVLSNPLKVKALKETVEKKKSKKESRKSHRSRSRSPSDSKRHAKNVERGHRIERKQNGHRHEDRPRERMEHSHKDRDYRSSRDDRDRRYQRSRSPPADRHQRHRSPPRAVDRGDAERERQSKLEAMRQNAKELHEIRKERVQQYQAEEDQEADRLRKSKQYASDEPYFRTAATSREFDRRQERDRGQYRRREKDD